MSAASRYLELVARDFAKRGEAEKTEDSIPWEFLNYMSDGKGKDSLTRCACSAHSGGNAKGGECLKGEVQDESLQAHDDKYHNPNHAEHGHFDPETMKCGKREAMAKEDDADGKVDEGGKSAFEKMVNGKFDYSKDDKLLFVDFDGVLTSSDTGMKSVSQDKYGVDEDCIKRIKDICDATGAKIVIASNWRKFREDGEFMGYKNPIPKLLDRLGDLVKGSLPAVRHKTKSESLEIWKQQHPEFKGKIAILDDDEKEGYDDTGFYKTETDKGVTDTIARDIMRHLGRKKDESTSTVGSAIAPEDDAAYADAVKRGDKETALRMVREAAAKAMPNTKVVGEDGLPLVVYHGSRNKFTQFDLLKCDENRDHQLGSDRGFWFTSNYKGAKKYGKCTNVNTPIDWDSLLKGTPFRDKEDFDRFAIYLSSVNTPQTNKVFFAKRDAYFDVQSKISKHKNSDRIASQPNVYSVFLNIENPQEINGEFIGVGVERDSFLDSASRLGDGAVIYNADMGGSIGDEYIVFNSSQIKSADITYDDDGNLIPLSKRFNMESVDIRDEAKGKIEKYLAMCEVGRKDGDNKRTTTRGERE